LNLGHSLGRRIPLSAALAFSAVVCAVVAGFATAGARAQGWSSGSALADGIARGLIAAIPLAVAFYACRQRATERFGRWFLIMSGWWALAMLSSSSIPLVYSIGRVSAWVAEGLLVYVVLIFPTGRLSGRLERALTVTTAVAVLALFLPSALLVSQYPLPAPYTSCHTGCPHNVFMLASAQPHIMTAVIQPLRELISVVVFLLVGVRLLGRARAANALLRRAIVPVLVVAAARFLVMAVSIASRRAGSPTLVLQVEFWLSAVSVPAVALAFLVGIARWRLFVNAAIVKVARLVGPSPEPQRVRDVVAEAFEDPELQLGWWLRKEQRYVRSDGQSLELSGHGRHLTEVRDGKRRAVAIVHDQVLADEPLFMNDVGNWAVTAFDRKQQVTQTSRILGELRDSRARILAAADDERRRIERDLHDSAQQRLVALRIELEIAAEQADDDPVHAAMLRELGAEVEDALDEIRSLTQGIYPALLDRSLEDAIRSTALRCPIPTTVEVDGLSSYPHDIAVAVYFCIAEALQNVAKHAHDARSANVDVLESDNMLRFSVSDDGDGFAPGTARVGAGMIHMKDRVATVGGELKVRSRPGQGTRISGEIPLSPIPAPRVPQHAPRVLGAAHERRGVAG
jgi:signal transduction histidine kinase